MNEKLFLTIILIMFVQLSFAQTKIPESFTSTLDRANIAFSMPEGYKETEVIKNDYMNYSYAIKHVSEKFEIRYTIQPMDSLLTQYEKYIENGVTMIHPNKIFPANAIAAGSNIGGNIPKSAPFPDEAVKKEYNADKGVMALLTPRENFANGYKYCMMISLFKENYGTAYIFYMADDQETFNKLMPFVFYNLRFN